MNNFLVEKYVGKVVEQSCVNVDKMFGFLKNSVRISTKSCSVDKFCNEISTFGFVRFTSVLCRILGGFPHFPHSLLLLLNIYL